VQVKSNLAPMGSAILFEVADKGVNFLDEMELSAEDAFSVSAPRMGRPNAREEAATDFIRSLLAGGDENGRRKLERYPSRENLRRGSAENRVTQRAQERKLRKSQCRHRANCPQCSLQGHGRFDLQRVFPAAH